MEYKERLKSGRINLGHVEGIAIIQYQILVIRGTQHNEACDIVNICRGCQEDLKNNENKYCTGCNELYNRDVVVCNGIYLG